jgi:signal transduction histidine kinase
MAAIFAIASTLMAEVFTELTGMGSDIISGLVVAIILTFFYQPLRKFIEQVTNVFLFKKTYDKDKLLSKVSDISSSILDLHNLLGSISGILDESFHTERIGIVLLDDKQKKLEVFYQVGFDPKQAEKLVSHPEVIVALRYEAKQLNGLLVIDEMKTRFENGEFKPYSPELLLALHETGIAVILPLFIQDQLIGVIALGNKKSGDPYNTQDLKILKIVAAQAAVAIENARLYDELKDFNVKLEEEVRRKTSQLRQANEELKRLDEVKSEFISIASHQLRTPLTVIKGYISMMREGSFGEVPPKIMDNLEKVYLSNERLIGLVENLLDISRIESGRQEFDWKQIQLADLAKTVIENLGKQAKDKGLKLTLHKIDKDLPKVLADNKIHEVMMNFVDNAIKYTPSGKIDVYLKNEPKDMITFCVKDTGRGIDPQIKSNLFKKFSRGKDSFRIHTEGVGLGLYVAKMIIDAHSGKIWAESEGRDNGSQFCFSIPLQHTPKDIKPKFGTKVKK